MPTFTVTGPGGSSTSSGLFTITEAGSSGGTGIFDYGSLKTAVAAFLHRGDLADKMDTVTDLAEARIRRILRDRTVGPVDFLLSDGVDLPSDCGELRTLRYADTRAYPYAISISSPANVSIKRGMRGDLPGLPETVAVVQRKLYVAPLTDGAIAVQITYYQTVPPLVADTDTNWLLDSAPDVYLYGMLLNFAQFLVDDERVPMWEASFTMAMKEMERARERREYAGLPLETINEYSF